MIIIRSIMELDLKALGEVTQSSILQSYRYTNIITVLQVFIIFLLVLKYTYILTTHNMRFHNSYQYEKDIWTVTHDSFR